MKQKSKSSLFRNNFLYFLKTFFVTFGVFLLLSLLLVFILGILTTSNGGSAEGVGMLLLFGIIPLSLFSCFYSFCYALLCIKWKVSLKYSAIHGLLFVLYSYLSVYIALLLAPLLASWIGYELVDGSGYQFYVMFIVLVIGFFLFLGAHPFISHSRIAKKLK